MSTNKTQYYNLHSWEPEDDFLRSEFNENFTILDTKLKRAEGVVVSSLKTMSSMVTTEKTAREQADTAEAAARAEAITAEQNARAEAITAEQNARAAAITAEQNARAAAINTLATAKAEIVIGTYQGGVWTTTDPHLRVIDLGLAPKALLLVRQDGVMGEDYHVAGGLLLQGGNLYVSGSSSVAASLQGSVLNIYNVSYSGLNQANREYRYLAIT